MRVLDEELMATPEITKTPTWAERVVRFMDDGFKVPGTSIRFGADALLGLVPVAGDLASTASTLSLFWLALERRAPTVIIARMLLNVGIDLLVGSIPVLGDLFDFAFKANRRNLTLIERSTEGPHKKPLKRDYLLVGLAVTFMLLSLITPILLLISIIAWLRT